MKQVVTIGQTGEVSGLQMKPGMGFDLRKLGPAQIKRASLIEWCENEQFWYIRVLPGVVTTWILRDHPHIIRIAGATVTLEAFRAATGKEKPEVPHTTFAGSSGSYLYFGEYEDAVKVEIEFLNALRLKGICD